MVFTPIIELELEEFVITGMNTELDHLEETVSVVYQMIYTRCQNTMVYYTYKHVVI